MIHFLIRTKPFLLTYCILRITKIYFLHVIQYWFTCRPRDFTVSEDAGIEPRSPMRHTLKLPTNLLYRVPSCLLYRVPSDQGSKRLTVQCTESEVAYWAESRAAYIKKQPYRTEYQAACCTESQVTWVLKGLLYRIRSGLLSRVPSCLL
jgi:hypothetical protein